MPSELNENQIEAVRQAARRELARRGDKYFCRYFVMIEDKKGNAVPFVWNESQEELEQIVQEQEAQGKPVRILVLKCRQRGISTWFQAKILCKTATQPNKNALTVAHTDDSTATLLEKQKFMVAKLPEDMKPLQKASNANAIVFDKPTLYKGSRMGLHSRHHVKTAGGFRIGRGDTHQYVHLSELAQWPGSINVQMTGIMQSVPYEPGTIVIGESTANGYNDFRKLWKDAEAGTNAWTPVFFPWHSCKEYAMQCTDIERAEIMGSLNEYERKITELFNLTAEQIKWYRWALANNCGGDVNLMKQENPSYPDEAFISTGRPVFNIEAIQLRIEALHKQYATEPYYTGRFTFQWENPETQDRIRAGSWQWVDDPNGSIRIYEKPQRGHPYTMGGDTKGEGHDFYTATVRDNSTGKRVATLKMQLSNSKPYTHQVYCLGRFYNDALVGIEMNFNTAPIEELERLNYPRQYMREVYDKIGNDLQKKHGWKTDGNTRRIIIDREIAMVEEHLELFVDIDTLEEMLTFVYDSNNREDAQDGYHDDLLFSDMIAQEIGGQQRTTVQEEPKPAKRKLYDTIKRGGVVVIRTDPIGSDGGNTQG